VLARYSRAGFSFALKHGMVLVRFIVVLDDPLAWRAKKIL
jgi:hypothetical protein